MPPAERTLENRWGVLAKVKQVSAPELVAASGSGRCVDRVDPRVGVAAHPPPPDNGGPECLPEMQAAAVARSRNANAAPPRQPELPKTSAVTKNATAAPAGAR